MKSSRWSSGGRLTRPAPTSRLGKHTARPGEQLTPGKGEGIPQSRIRRHSRPPLASRRLLDAARQPLEPLGEAGALAGAREPRVILGDLGRYRGGPHRGGWNDAANEEASFGVSRRICLENAAHKEAERSLLRLRSRRLKPRSAEISRDQPRSAEISRDQPRPAETQPPAARPSLG